MSTLEERFLAFIKNEFEIKKQEGTFPEHAEESEYYKEHVGPLLLTCEALFQIPFEEMNSTLSQFSLYSWYFQDEMGQVFADIRKRFSKDELRNELSFLQNAEEIVDTIYYRHCEEDDKSGDYEWFKELNPDYNELLDCTFAAILYLNNETGEKIDSIEAFQKSFERLGLDAKCVDAKRMADIIRVYNESFSQKENELNLEDE